MSQPSTLAKGSTRTDLRLTKAPADTPRARLHRLASMGTRLAQEIQRIVALGPDDVRSLRALARRGIRVLRGNPSRGARLVTELCHGLDHSLAAMIMLDGVDLAAVCDGLTSALAELELAENKARDLQGSLAAVQNELMAERGRNHQLRAQLTAELAAERVRTTAALRDVPRERWDEPTCERELSADERRAIDSSGALPRPALTTETRRR